MAKAKKVEDIHEDSETDRFSFQASDNLKITPPPEGDTTEEEFRDYDFPEVP